MTTREELIDGLRMIIREGLRTTAKFGPDDWAYKVHDESGGWTAKQLYCHLAATAEITPGFIGALANAPAGRNAAAGFDIDAFNAQQVSAKAALEPEPLREAFKASHEKLIEFVRGMPEEQLELERRFGYVAGRVADIMQTVLVLHGLAHIYYAQSRPMN
jgi:hypothetical protein